MRVVTAVIMFTNHGVNFFLYLLTGPRFRQELACIFRCPKNQVEPKCTMSSISIGSQFPSGAHNPALQYDRQVYMWQSPRCKRVVTH